MTADRDVLTEDEREELSTWDTGCYVCDCQTDQCHCEPSDRTTLYAAVESIVAARVQEYAEKFESLSDRAKTAATELGAKNDRLAAELAAANTEVARMKDIYRVHELGRLEAEAERDAYRAQRDEAREQRDIWAGKARVNGDDYEAAKATLDRVTALPDEWEAAEVGVPSPDTALSGNECAADLRAALTPEGKE